MGYQRVASVRRLPTLNALTGGGVDVFEVILYSTGHGKNLADLEELIKNRLDEAHLPGLGPLDSNASYIHRLEENMPGKHRIKHLYYSNIFMLLVDACWVN